MCSWVLFCEKTSKFILTILSSNSAWWLLKKRHYLLQACLRQVELLCPNFLLKMHFHFWKDSNPDIQLYVRVVVPGSDLDQFLFFRERDFMIEWLSSKLLFLISKSITIDDVKSMSRFSLWRWPPWGLFSSNILKLLQTEQWVTRDS